MGLAARLGTAFLLAAAAAGDTSPPAIGEVAATVRGSKVKVTAVITDETGVLGATCHYRSGPGSNWSQVSLTAGEGAIQFTGSFEGASGFQYYIEAYDELGNGPSSAGSRDHPFSVGSQTTSRSSPALATPSPERPGPPPAQAIPAPLAAAPRGLVAVLELRSMLDAREAKGIPASYLTDVVRAVVNREAPSLDLMTRENIVTMLRASNKTLEECEGQCEVDTGRLLGVDYIFSGDLVHFGSKFKVSLRVHETAKGRLIDTAFASANDADALEEATRIAAIGLVRRFLGPTGGARNR